MSEAWQPREKQGAEGALKPRHKKKKKKRGTFLA